MDRALRAKIQGASDFINGVNLNRLLRHLAGDNYRFRGVSFGSDSTAGGPGLSFEYYGAAQRAHDWLCPHHGLSLVENGARQLKVSRPVADTWLAPNTTQKIDHIFIVMMENRSFDHVLGYRASRRRVDASRGLFRRTAAQWALQIAEDELWRSGPAVAASAAMDVGSWEKLEVAVATVVKLLVVSTVSPRSTVRHLVPL